MGFVNQIAISPPNPALLSPVITAGTGPPAQVASPTAMPTPTMDQVTQPLLRLAEQPVKVVDALSSINLITHTATPVVNSTAAMMPTVIDLGPGSTQPDYGEVTNSNSTTKVDRVQAAGVTEQTGSSISHHGNVVTCVWPDQTKRSWIKLYRLTQNQEWVDLGEGIGSIEPSGFVKIDGLPVDVARFGGSGEPYRVELWLDDRVIKSTGNIQIGEPEFRVFPYTDNITPWLCPASLP